MDVFAGLLPPDVSPVVFAALSLASFFTSALTAAFGIGGGVALLTLMGFLLPVGALIPVHGVVQLGSNAGRSFLQRRWIRWQPLALFLAGAAIGSLAGAQFVVQLPDAPLKILLGAFILVVVWLKVPALRAARPGWFALGGVLTSFAGMFVGASGPLVLALFEKAFDERRNVVATHATAMVAQHGLKVMAFALAGFAFARWLPLMAVMIATGYLGTVAGSRLLAAMAEQRFRSGFKLVMSVLALAMIARGVLVLAG